MGRKFKSTCCLPECGSSKVAGSTTDSGLSFHEFPCDVRLREKWIQIIRSRFHSFDLKYSSRICSLHFAEDCFRSWTKRSSLLCKDAIPTIFPSLLANVTQPENVPARLNPATPQLSCDSTRLEPKHLQLDTFAQSVKQRNANVQAPNSGTDCRGPRKRISRRRGGFKTRTKSSCSAVRPEVLTEAGSAVPKKLIQHCPSESNTKDETIGTEAPPTVGESLHPTSSATVPQALISSSPSSPSEMSPVLLGQLDRVEEAAQGGNEGALLLLEQIWAYGRPVHYFSRRMLQMCASWRRCNSRSYDHVRGTQLFTLPCHASIVHYCSGKTVAVRGWDLNRPLPRNKLDNDTVPKHPAFWTTTKAQRHS